MVPAPYIQDTPGPLREDRYWPRKFTEGQDVDPESLNRPYISELQVAWKKLDDDGDEDDGDEDDGDEDDRENVNGVEGGLDEAEKPLKEDSCVARIFMRGRWHQESSEMLETDYEIAVVENFSGDIHFEDLQKPDAAETDPLAVFEERFRTGAYRKGRMLTSGQLYKALQDKCFAVETFRGALGQGGKVQKFRPNAGQKWLYIHNITAHATAALMATTSGYEAPAIRALLPLHLNRTAVVRVQIPPRGFQTFTFILSIPRYTKGALRLPHARRWLNGDLLRKAVTIPIMSKSGRVSAAADVFGELHEAQTTIVLTGIDEPRWSRFTLVDSNRVTETVGHYDAGPQHDDPRVHFLWVWDEWIAKIYKEWDDIVGYVDRTVTGMCSEDSSTFESGQPDVQRLRDSVMKKAQLASWLVPLHLQLSGIVGAWRQFQNSDDIKYFRDDVIQSEAARRRIDALHAIEGNYSRLQLTQEKLDKLTETLKGDPLNSVLVAVRSEQELASTAALAEMTKLGNNLALQSVEAGRQSAEATATLAEMMKLGNNLALQSVEAGRQSVEAGRQSVEAGNAARKLTNTSMCFLPFMLAFSFFSMSPTVLPFVPNWQSLVVTLATFTTATLLLANFLDVICHWLRSKSKMASDVWGLWCEYLSSLRGPRQQHSESGNGAQAMRDLGWAEVPLSNLPAGRRTQTGFGGIA